MSGHPTIANYFDLSLQHSSSRLLRAMRRPGSGDGHLALIERIRTMSPDAAMRSSFIVGFPGESDSDVEDLATFLRQARLDWAGFFPYSREEGTTAAEMDDQLPADMIGERLRYIQNIQEEITAEKSVATVGNTVRVLVDQVEDGQPVGRSFREAPEIDGVILLDKGTAGEWVNATIVGAYGTDTSATVANL
jgi:tRNA A37 methylthiotransferase MiaB